ncbi:MAG TPA: hypothetical protein VFZ66_19625 [Herpetosiphonaceae bacterium]
MATTITLPDTLEFQLRQQAQVQHRSVEDIALDILRDALDIAAPSPTTDDIVARIKATPPNPQNIRPARGSLADALRDEPGNPDFDLDQWERDWAEVEAEMRAMTRTDNLAEGWE